MMTSTRIKELSLGARLAVAALVLLGFVGGCLVVAHSGFATSPKRGGSSVVVPAPQAYLLAVVMYAMSAIGLVALLRERHVSTSGMALAAVLYACAAALLILVLRSPQ